MAQTTSLVFNGGVIPSTSPAPSGSGKAKLLKIGKITVTEQEVQVTKKVICDPDSVTTVAPFMEVLTSARFAELVQANNILVLDDGTMQYLMSDASIAVEDGTSVCTAVNFLGLSKENRAKVLYPCTRLTDELTLQQVLEVGEPVETGFDLVKAYPEDTEAGTLIDKLEIEDTIDDDPDYQPLLEIVPTDGKVAINEDRLHETLNGLDRAIDGVIETINELDMDSVPHAYLGSTLFQSAGDSVTTGTPINIFSCASPLVGDCFEFEQTTTIDDTPFGYVWIEPGTYLINASVTLQWVGNPRGTFIAKIGKVMGENFDFSQEQELLRSTTRIVTIPSRIKLSVNITYDAGTPVMGFWIQSLQVVKLAGGMSQTNITHDDTLVGQGSVANPLGVDEAKVAQSTLAGNLAPAFDLTRTEDTKYLAGESVVYEGKTYIFKVDHYGAWAAADVYEISVAEMLVKYSAGKTKQVNDGETNQIIQSDGSLTTSSSWRTYKFLVSSGTVFYKSYAAYATASNTLAVAFYSSEDPSSASLISGVKFNATGVWQKGLVLVPSGTKCVLICSRTADGRTDNEAVVGENLPELFSKIENKVASMKTALTIADATIDSYYFNGTAFVASNAWKRFTFDCYGNYFKVKAVAATNISSFGEVIFLDANKAVISYESFGGSTGVAITKELSVPSGCRYICVCNRTENLADPEFYAYSETMRDAVIAVIPVIDAKIGGVESEVLDLENKFISLDLENAIMQVPYFFDGTTLTFSASWATYVFKNEGFSKVKVKAASSSPGFSEIVFCSDENLSIISNVVFGIGGTVTKEAQVPAGCKYICICNRKASLETPEFSAWSENLQNVFETIKSVGENFAGVIKFKPVASRVIYDIRIGEVSEVAKHFKMALVKDGVVKYFVNATNILRDENGWFESVLDGTDGDLLIVNDVPVYFITGYVGDAAVRLFSLVPFEYGGVQARKIEPRGEAPSLCFIDNINDSHMGSHEANLGTGKSHYTRNSSNVAYYSPMSGMVGKYVPSESGGVISYAYDSSKSFIESGACRPTVWLNQNTAERAASNKDTGDVAYTNMDLLSLEIVLALAEAECNTNYINSPELFGNGFASPATPETAINESVFTDGTTARNGVRFKDSSDAWVYRRLNAKPFNNDKFLFEMLTDWMCPWEIMEQHLVLSYAKVNSIAVNTWFVYNGNEYKYINVGTLKGLSDGVMTAVLFKKFRSKIASSITYNGASVAGNDIEFVIISSVYRGWILDVSPHRWVTGLNVTVDDANNYKFFGTLNYKKYITNQDYTEIDEDELFDFEKQYNIVSEITDDANTMLHSRYTKEGSAYIPTECGTALGYFECSSIETDKKKAGAGKKIVTGVKLGYGAFTEYTSRNFLYLWHPRTYTIAKAGYSSFVCQNVKV